MFRKTLCALLCVLLSAASLTPRTANAQSGEDIAKGLLRALIESQLEKSRRRNGGPQQIAPPPNGNRRPQQLTQEMQRLRPITASFTQESSTLAALLQTDSRRSIEARRGLPDALQLQAMATALNQRAATNNHHGYMLEDYRALNSDWVKLSHQLGQCPNLSNQTTACLKRLSALDAQYCSIFGIQPQFDNRELTRAAYTLTNYLRDLVDDIQGQPLPRNTSRDLLRDLSRLSQKTEYFAGLVTQGAQYQTVVAEYQNVYQSWAGVENALSGFTSHSITRSMRRIRESHQTIHQLLRLEMGIDKNHVLNLIHEVDHQMTELFRTMTLEQLMTLSDGDAVPEAADRVYGTVQNIDDLVHRDQSPQAIAEAWVYTDEAWSQFSYYVAPLQGGTVSLKLKAIAEAMQSLQQALGVTVQYDRNALVQNASSLEQLSERLAETIRRWQTHPGNHDRNLVARAEKMVTHFHHIEQSLLANKNRGHHLNECDQAIAQWQQIRPALKTCDTDEREQFDHIVATLTPEVVRLRTMLDE